MRLPSTLTRTLFKLKKHAPEILVVSGVVGSAVAGVVACKETKKAMAIGTIYKETVNEIESSDKPEEEKELALRQVRLKTGLKYVVCYLPSFMIELASAFSILKGHGVLRGRYTGTSAALATQVINMNNYRKNVIDKFGEDVDKELRYNIKNKEFDEIKVLKNGKQKTKKVSRKVCDLDHSDFAKFFQQGCTGWTKDPESNLTFLKLQEDEANKLLARKGYLVLNDVYDMLGIPRTRAGMIYGWVYNPEVIRQIDFGIYNSGRESNRDFVNGYESVILLDFNVMGDIYTMTKDCFRNIATE